jgi:hypothetical protein
MKLGDLPVYVSGERGDVGIIVFQEIFGIESGRLKQVSTNPFYMHVISEYSHCNSSHFDNN